LPCAAESAEVDRAAGKLWGYYQAAKVTYAACRKANVADWNEQGIRVEQWLARNAVVVEAAEKVALESLRKSTQDEAQYNLAVNEWQEGLSFLKRQIESTVLLQIAPNPAQFCNSTATNLGSGRSELSDRFPSEVAAIGAKQ
jgi:hypothetical protein